MSAPHPSSRGVILVVDDDPVVRMLLREYLSDWTVVEASDGQSGLAKARERPPDVVIADWVMPRMSGPEMVKQLRTDPSLSHVPVVMLTALTDVEHRAESYQSGADHFLPKDFAPEELRAIIERAVQRKAPLEFAAPLMRALHDRVGSADMAEIGEAVSLLGEFQQRMLPPAEFRVGSLAVGACLVPSVIASGDFYDYLPWNDGRELGFVVGDVSGHGLAAAYFMVMVRTALRVLSRQQSGLAETVAALNEILLAETPTGWFVTLFYGVANPETAKLRYVNAGHCPAVLCHARKMGTPYPFPPEPRKDAQASHREMSMVSPFFDLLEPTGPALGIFPGHAYREGAATLNDGDHLVCATDGVIDAIRTDNPGERYEWIRSVVAQHRQANAVAIAEALVRGAEADAIDNHRDDLAALVLHRAV